MHPFSVLTLGIFVAGYITARWDLVTRLYELVIFAWDHGVVVYTYVYLISRICVRLISYQIQDRAAKGFFVLSIFFFLFLIPIERIATRETTLVGEFKNYMYWQRLICFVAPSIHSRRHLRTRTAKTTWFVLRGFEWHHAASGRPDAGLLAVGCAALAVARGDCRMEEHRA